MSYSFKICFDIIPPPLSIDLSLPRARELLELLMVSRLEIHAEKDL